MDQVEELLLIKFLFDLICLVIQRNNQHFWLVHIPTAEILSTTVNAD